MKKKKDEEKVIAPKQTHVYTITMYIRTDQYPSPIKKWLKNIQVSCEK